MNSTAAVLITSRSVVLLFKPKLATPTGADLIVGDLTDRKKL